MSEFVSGLLSQKPSSPEPKIGDVRRFELEQRPKKSGEGFWTKLKNAGDTFGAEYEIVKCDRKDDYTNDHGTLHQYSLLLKPSSGEGVGATSSGQSDMGGAASTTSTSREDSIDRAVAFKGAVELAASEVRAGKLAIEDTVDRINALTAELLNVVKGSPDPPSQPAQSGTNAAADPDDGIPFAASRI